MIRNIDPARYRLLKARAAAEGLSLGEAINGAIDSWLARGAPGNTKKRRRGTLSDLPVIDFGPGSEDWSERVDEILYGEKR